MNAIGSGDKISKNSGIRNEYLPAFPVLVSFVSDNTEPPVSYQILKTLLIGFILPSRGGSSRRNLDHS